MTEDRKAGEKKQEILKIKAKIHHHDTYIVVLSYMEIPWFSKLQ